MKKFTKIMSIAAVLLCGLMITGCGDTADRLKEALSGPKDTWFRRTVEYTNKDGEKTDLYVYMCYSDTGYTANDMDSTAQAKMKSGLTVVVTSKTEADTNPVISGLTSGKYILKNFSDQTATDLDDTDDDSNLDSSKKGKKSFKMSTAKWNWMYNTVTLEKQNGTITPLRDDANYSELTNLSSFSWKKVMASYLLDNLLED